MSPRSWQAGCKTILPPPCSPWLGLDFQLLPSPSPGPTRRGPQGHGALCLAPGSVRQEEDTPARLTVAMPCCGFMNKLGALQKDHCIFNANLHKTVNIDSFVVITVHLDLPVVIKV